MVTRQLGHWANPTLGYLGRRGLLHEFDFDLDVNAVPDDQTAGLEDLVPGEVEVPSIERSLGRKARPREQTS